MVRSKKSLNLIMGYFQNLLGYFDKAAFTL